MNITAPRAAAAVLLTALTLAGCTVRTTPPALTEAQVETTVSDRLVELVGQRPDSVDCPGELPGVPGSTLRCTLTAGTDRYAVDVQVTHVDGARINFDFEVADRPLT